MVQKIVDALVKKQSQNYAMTDEDEKIYKYGYTLLCEVFLNSVIALAIGIAFSKIKEVIFFLAMYIPLRSFCGGWHADKIWKCTVISNVILLLQVYGIENIKMYLTMSGMLLIFFFNMVCIYFISPVDTEMKKISQDDKKIYKRKIKLILVFHVIIAIISVLADADEFVFSLMFVYIIQNVMLLMEIIKHRKCCFTRNGKLVK